MSGFDKRAYYDAISGSYAEHVVSPYELGIEMPLAGDIDRWFENRREGGLAVDFGCGAGQSLALVAGRAGHVLGLDFSVGMLLESRRRLEEGGTRNVHADLVEPDRAGAWLSEPARHETMLVRGDLHDLGWLAGRVDLAIASNSITDEDATKSFHMFEQVASTVKKAGALLGLFPSWDATTYAMDLFAERCPEALELGTIDARGVYEHDGLRQKFWRPEEIEEQCAAHGLEVEALEKIRFPWSAMAESGWGDFDDCEEMWDWYLRARRI